MPQLAIKAYILRPVEGRAKNLVVTYLRLIITFPYASPYAAADRLKSVGNIVKGLMILETAARRACEPKIESRHHRARGDTVSLQEPDHPDRLSWLTG